MVRLNLKRADIQGKLNSLKAADKVDYEAAAGVGRELARSLPEDERLKQIGSDFALVQKVTTMCEVLSDAEDFEALHLLAQTLENLAHKTSCRNGSCFSYSSNSVPCNPSISTDVCKFMDGTVYYSLELGVVIPGILLGVSIVVLANFGCCGTSRTA
jgi:hypothetical protein